MMFWPAATLQQGNGHLLQHQHSAGLGAVLARHDGPVQAAAHAASWVLQHADSRWFNTKRLSYNGEQ